MYFAVTHLTLYKYSEAVSNSVMEVRMQPRSDDRQRCVRFSLKVSPDARALAHQDYLGNNIHTFDIPAPHTRLAIRAEAIVEVKPRPELPEALPEAAWEALDAQSGDPDLFDMLLPGHYTQETDLLKDFAREIDWRRRSDPLTLLRELNTVIHDAFDYQKNVT